MTDHTTQPERLCDHPEPTPWCIWCAQTGTPKREPAPSSPPTDDLVQPTDQVIEALAEIIARQQVELNRLADAEKERDRLAAVADRTGTRWCLCSLADRMNDRAQPPCPLHGEPRYWQARAAAAEARLAAVQALADEWESRAARGLISAAVGHEVPRLRAALAVDAEPANDPRADVWQEGYTAGHSNAMRRMSDEPDVAPYPNPYREPASDPDGGA